MKAQCKKCHRWFTISQTLEDLIEEGYISPLEVNLCAECAKEEAEEAEYLHELECILNQL